MKKLFENWNMFLNQKMEINENEAAMLRRLSRDNPTEEPEIAPPPAEDTAAIERGELKTRTYENLGEYADFWSWSTDEQDKAFGDIDPYEDDMDMEKLKGKLVAFVVNNAFIDENTARTEIVR